VVLFEQRRLYDAGQKALADKVEHAAVVRGDGLGFDVESFELNGAPRIIEMKTTAWGKETPFFITRNELAFSKNTNPHSICIACLSSVSSRRCLIYPVQLNGTACELAGCR
jgi:hypothetical protein